MNNGAADIRIRPTLDVSGLPSGGMDWHGKKPEPQAQ